MQEVQAIKDMATQWQDLLSIPTGRIAVIYGGDSAERDISLMSGTQVLAHLQAAGVDAFGIDLAGPDANGQTMLQQLQQHPMDAAFIAMHGPGGEDGTLQGVLEFLDVPYTGSGVMASSVSMHKLMTKMVWQSAGLPTPRWVLLQAGANCQTIAEDLGLPLVVKPVHEGSSLGVHIVNSVADMQAAWDDAQALDRLVMAEQFIGGEEYTVAILRGEALPAIRLSTDNEFYDLQAKYYSDDTQYSFDNELTTAQQEYMQELCAEAFAVLECDDWARVDVMRDGKGNNWLLEINTSPGMTTHSLVPMAAQRVGLSFQQLVVLVLNLCLLRSTQQQCTGGAV